MWHHFDRWSNHDRCVVILSDVPVLTVPTAIFSSMGVCGYIIDLNMYSKHLLTHLRNKQIKKIKLILFGLIFLLHYLLKHWHTKTWFNIVKKQHTSIEFFYMFLYKRNNLKINVLFFATALLAQNIFRSVVTKNIWRTIAKCRESIFR